MQEVTAAQTQLEPLNQRSSRSINRQPNPNEPPIHDTSRSIPQSKPLTWASATTNVSND